MSVEVDQLYFTLTMRSASIAPALADAEARFKSLGDFIKAHPTAAIGGLVAAITLVGIEVAKMAVEFDSAMRGVTALLPQASSQLEHLKEQVEDLSGQLPIAADNLAAGLRLIVQTGGKDMQDATAAMERLAVASKLSTASGTDLTSVISVLDGAMRAFGLHGTAAAQQLAELLFALSTGRAPLNEFASVLERVAPFAQSAGISLEDTARLIAAMYDKGVPTTVMLRGLRAALGGMGDGADTAKSILAQLGITVENVGGKLVVGGAIASEFAATAGDAADKTEKLATALQHVQESPGAQWTELMNLLKAAAVELGDQLATEILHWNNYWIAVQGPNKAPTGRFTTGDIHALTRTLEGPSSHDRGLLGVPTQGNPTPLNVRQYEAHVPTGRPGPAAAAPDPKALAQQEALLSQLQGQLESLSGNTVATALAALDRMEAKFVSLHTPTGLWLGQITQARTLLGDQGGVAQFTAYLDTVKQKVDDLKNQQAEGTQAWNDQAGALQTTITYLQAYVATLQAGSKAQQEGLALLQRYRDELTRMNTEQDAADRRHAEAQDEAEKAQEQADTKREQQLQKQTQAITEAARGALELAQAFGLVDQQVASSLASIVQIGTSMPKLLRTINTPTSTTTDILSAAAPVLGGLAGLVASAFGQSPAEQQQRAILEANNVALRNLTQQLKETPLSGTGGSTFTGVRGAVAATNQLTRGLPTSGAFQEVTSKALGSTLGLELAQAGVTMQDLQNIAKSLGITFDGTVQSFRQLNDALQQANLAEYASTTAGQLQGLQDEFKVFDITDPIAQLQKLKAVLTGQFGSAGLGGALGQDLTTGAGRDAAIAALEALFAQVQNGTIDASQLGGLSLDQFTQQLEQLLTLLRSSGATAGTTSQFTTNRQITETTGSLLQALFTTDVYWNQQTAENTAAMLAFLAKLTGSASVQPPTNAELSAFTGSGGGVVIQAGAIVVNVNGVSAGDAQAVGQQVGDAVVKAINRQLGVRQRARAKAMGQATLN